MWRHSGINDIKHVKFGVRSGHEPRTRHNILETRVKTDRLMRLKPRLWSPSTETR
jgi:hypothetical protein